MIGYNSKTEYVWTTPSEIQNEDGFFEEAVDAQMSEQLNNLYESIKPSINTDMEYGYIGMNVSEHDGVYWGILNCRINGEHKQIRF